MCSLDHKIQEVVQEDLSVGRNNEFWNDVWIEEGDSAVAVVLYFLLDEPEFLWPD